MVFVERFCLIKVSGVVIMFFFSELRVIISVMLVKIICGWGVLVVGIGLKCMSFFLR